MFNLYNDQWPILTHVPSQPPAKFVHDSGDRIGRAIDSLVSNGVIVSGGLVRESVLVAGRPGQQLGARWSARSSCTTPDRPRTPWSGTRSSTRTSSSRTGAQVGVDKEHDLARGFVVSPAGITVVGKGQAVPRERGRQRRDAPGRAARLTGSGAAAGSGSPC